MNGYTLVRQAREAFGDEPYIGTALEACEAFYMNGSADEQAGDVDGLYHVYRVNRWLVFTDSQGFKELAEEGSEEEARKRFETCEQELSAAEPVE